MKIKIEQKVLLDQLKDVSLAVKGKVSIESLKGIFIHVTEDTITMTGADDNVAIQRSINMIDDEGFMIKETGECLVEAQRLVSIVKKVPQDELTLSLKDTHLIITSGKSRFQIALMDAQEYPDIISYDVEDSVQVNGAIFKDAVQKTAYCVSKSETRPILTGVNCVLKEGKLEMVATDSHRLSRKVLKVESDREFNLVIPGESLKTFLKLDLNETITLSFSDNQISLSSADLHFQTRILEGNYPDVSRIYPEGDKSKVTISRQALLQSVESALLVAANDVIKMNLTDLCKIETQPTEIGRFEDEINYHELEGENVEINFNGRFLSEALKTLKEEMVEILITGKLRPFILKSPQEQDLSKLILPVRTY